MPLEALASLPKFSDFQVFGGVQVGMFFGFLQVFLDFVRCLGMFSHGFGMVWENMSDGADFSFFYDREYFS